MDVGAALRDAREQRRLSVDQLSRTTKISVATLRAIEKNEIDTLLGGIFIRGFLRAYAREVGLDVEDTVQRYLAQFEPRPDEGVPIEADDTWLELTPAVHPETNVDEAGQRAASVRLLFVGLALAIGLAGYLAFHESEHRRARPLRNAPRTKRYHHQLFRALSRLQPPGRITRMRLPPGGKT